MTRGALLKLLARPLIIVFAGFALIPVAVAFFVTDSQLAGGLTWLSLCMSAILGGQVGGEMATALRCSFTWPLPRFRRAVLLEFVACGVAVSALPGLVLAISTGALTMSVLASATGFVVFALSGVICLVPEASPLFNIAAMAMFFWAGASAPSIVLHAPLAFIIVAFGVSTATLWLGFATRTFRWASITARQQPVGPMSYQLHSLLGLRKRRSRPTGVYLVATARTPYIGTSVIRGVVSSYQSDKGAWLFGNLVFAVLLFVVMTFSFIWLNRLTDGPAAPPTLWFGLVMVGAIPASLVRHSWSSVVTPWSRRQHLAVAYTRDLLDTVSYLLTTCPVAIAVFFVLAHPDWRLIGEMARAAAATALFFPVLQWPDGPPIGRPWPQLRQTWSAAMVVRPIVIVAGVALFVYGLPALTPSYAGQIIVLGVLVAASQALYWLSLRRYLATRDLVGQEV